MAETNRKLARTRLDGYFDIRVFHWSRNAKKDPRFLFGCGCCEGKLEVYYGGDGLEINGVMGSGKNWRGNVVAVLNIDTLGQEPRKRARSRPSKASKREALDPEGLKCKSQPTVAGPLRRPSRSLCSLDPTSRSCRWRGRPLVVGLSQAAPSWAR